MRCVKARTGSSFLRTGQGALSTALFVLVAAGCGSAEPPEAYPGRPIDPPNKEDDLLAMMTGSSTPATTTSVATSTPTPTASATVEPTAAATSASASASASAKPHAGPKKPPKKTP